MNPNPPQPKALLHEHDMPCHVCAAPTQRRRSMTHLDGPPTAATDIVPICEDCDPAWTAALSTP